PMHALAVRGCRDCSFRQACGGLVQQQMFGCFGQCGSCTDECDYVCPQKPGFWKQWAEIGGLKPGLNASLPGLAVRLPRYVAMIRNGSTRVDPVPEDIVALNTFDVINQT